MDLVIREFTDKLIREINATALPIEVKKLVLKDIYCQVEKTADKIIQQEIAERNNQINKEAVNTAEPEEAAEK